MTSHSQAGQDLWVNAMLEGRRDGFYVDIGCNHPTAINNTWAFEQMGWNGILVDVLSGCEVRKGKFFQCDASHPTTELRAAYESMPYIVDFLSLDVDDATLATFDTLPWNWKQFRVACIEHDCYLRGPEMRDAIRERMHVMGYE